MKTPALCLLIFLLSSGLAAQEKKQVVEEIVARVNNEIITLTDIQRARQALRQEVEQECRNCSAQQMAEMLEDREKNLLRDLIDQSLLVQRAKDVGVNVETDVVKRLDQVRQQNNFASMEDLEKAVGASGMSFEEFRNNIRNGLMTQEVIFKEVRPRITIGNEEVRKYYEEHKKEFDRPEQVYLREIFVSTDGKPEDQLPELEKKAKGLLERLKKGEDFSELARRYSDGSTAQQGGDLGIFERGQLAKEIEDIVFKMNRNDTSDVIRTKTGFLILRVEQRFEAGLQPVDKVEPEIMNRLYMERLQPAMRAYLKQLREESYVMVKPGHVDTAGVASTPIVEVEPTPEQGKDKKSKKKKSSE